MVGVMLQEFSNSHLTSADSTHQPRHHRHHTASLSATATTQAGARADNFTTAGPPTMTSLYSTSASSHVTVSTEQCCFNFYQF